MKCHLSSNRVDQMNAKISVDDDDNEGNFASQEDGDDCSLINQVEAVYDDHVSNSHNQAFINPAILDNLSPIPTLDERTRCSIASTPVQVLDEHPVRLQRSIKRRRRSRFSEKKPRQKRKVEQPVADQVIPSRNACLGIDNEKRPESGQISIDEKICDQLKVDITVIPSSIPDSPENRLSEILQNNTIQLTDSLCITTDMHSKLTDTLDELIMSEECNLSSRAQENLQKNKNALHSFYGLPIKVKEVLKSQRGIENVYDWQNDCLNLPAIDRRRNLIYSLPTSGGKTLVAEILIMKELLVREKNALLVLPYVSIVQEKVRGFSPFAVELGFHVEEYAASKGSFPPKKRRKNKSLYIATIEKADAIINILIENERLEELGLVVVDELHMIGEGGGRGARLEMCLTKLMYTKAQIQIIGMSATLGNLCDLQEFLNAEIYCNDFRPVQLTEHIKFGDTVYKVDHAKLRSDDEEAIQPIRRISHAETLEKKMVMLDSDHVSALALEVVPTNSCLVFCATKKNCENVASMIVNCMPSEMKETRKLERQQLLKAIYDNVNNVCKVLCKTIPFGISYHHSGLTMDERKLIEEAYSSGVLCLLCCTSTLAAGVNLPAKRVILRAPYIGSSFLTKSRYNQMIGRAGRAGIDSSGESIMIVQPKDKKKVLELLQGSFDRCFSSLDYDHSKGLRALILNTIGLKLCSTIDEVEAFLRLSLFSVQGYKYGEFNVRDRIITEVKTLTDIGLVQMKEIVKNEICSQCLEATVLGRATYKGCLDVDSTQFIYKELKKGTENLVLANELHLLYLATPLDNVKDVRLNWMPYYQHISRLTPDEMNAAEVIGVSESYIARKSAGQRCSKDKVDEFVLRRFWLTLMIYQLVKQVSVWEVANKFNSTRGFVQGLLTSASSFAYLLTNFTGELPEFWSLKLLFEALLQKLSYTATLELIPLMEIPGVKQARARQLYKAGYHTLKSLAWADANDLCQNIEHMPRNQARLIVSSAKMLLKEKAESLREEVEDMMMHP